MPSGELCDREDCRSKADPYTISSDIYGGPVRVRLCRKHAKVLDMLVALGRRHGRRQMDDRYFESLIQRPENR